MAEFADEVEVLLDKYDRHPAIDELSQDDADLLDHVWLDTLRGFIKKQHLGVADEGAGDGQLLLLSAGQIAAHALGHGFEHREEFENFFGNGSAATVGTRLQADLQIFGDRELRENLPPLGNQRDAFARPAIGGKGCYDIADRRA